MGFSNTCLKVMSENKQKKGPKPERVKIEGDWGDAVDKALKKPRRKEGWPKPDDDSHFDPDSGPQVDD